MKDLTNLEDYYYQFKKGQGMKYLLVGLLAVGVFSASAALLITFKVPKNNGIDLQKDLQNGGLTIQLAPDDIQPMTSNYQLQPAIGVQQ